MPAFTPDQWLILLLVFLLGLFLGLALMASPKWKHRYREEVARREALEAENAQLRREADEMASLRGAAARDEARRREAAAESDVEVERRIADRRSADRRAEDRAAEDDLVRSERLRAEEDALRRRDGPRGPL